MKRSLPKMLMLVACAAVFAAAAAFAAQDSTPEAATLKGKFTFDGDPPAPKQLDCKKEPACCQKPLFDQSLVVGKNKELANVFVYVRSKGLKVPPELAAAHKEPVLLDNKNCTFEPHALGVVLGQKLVIGNSDGFGHNSYIAAQGINPTVPAGQKIEFEPKKLSPVVPDSVTCSIHGWMTAWVLVRPDPFFDISAEDGTFEITGLPADEELEFQVWHERAGFVRTVKLNDKATTWDKGRFKKKLKKGVNDLGTIPISAKIFK